MFQAIRERKDPDVARRMIELYEFMRDEGGRPSFGTGTNPSVTMWLGERAELTRLADLIRQIPGAHRSLDGIEDRDFGVIHGMSPEEALASDRALEASPSTLSGRQHGGRRKPVGIRHGRATVTGSGDAPGSQELLAVVAALIRDAQFRRRFRCSTAVN